MNSDAPDEPELSSPEIRWDELAPGSEVSATVLVASGFALPRNSRVRERYRVVGALGAGMMGQVLAVTLLGHDDPQTYALKVVARSAAHDDPAQRAEDERRADLYAELLRSEAAKQDIVQRHGVPVARLFALVQLDDGAIGMRMEIARGRSLDGWIADGQATRDNAPDVFRAVSVVRKLVSQLRRLHELVEPGTPSGFVHCDIKPGNVFVDDRDPTDLYVTLLDFGVATAGQALVAGLGMQPTSRRTFVMQETGGTLGYAPPTHFARKATPLSDIHASLVILYELIALALPWPLADTGDAHQDYVDTEAAMARGPRPVRDLRPRVLPRDAVMLDAFFRREFAQLHELNDAAALALASPDRDVQAKMRARLGALAREYQSKLDELCVHFAPNGSLSAGGGAGPRLRQSSSIQRVVVVGDSGPQPPARPPSVPPPSAGDADATGALLLVKRASAGRSPAASHARSPDDTGALPLLRTSAASPGSRADAGGANRVLTPPALPAVPPPAPPAVATPERESELVPRRPAPPPARPVAPPRPADASAAPLLRRKTNPHPARKRPWLLYAGGAVIVAGALGGYFSVRSATSAQPASGAQACTCVAPAAGVRVVAAGGGLEREVLLCAATTPSADGATFTGRGAIPPEVIRAQPTLACRAAKGAAPLALAHVTGADGAATFRCREAP